MFSLKTERLYLNILHTYTNTILWFYYTIQDEIKNK